MSNLTLEVEFIRKYPSGGCAFAGEFDFADFVVKMHLNANCLTNKLMTLSIIGS